MKIKLDVEMIANVREVTLKKEESVKRNVDSTKFATDTTVVALTSLSKSKENVDQNVERISAEVLITYVNALKKKKNLKDNASKNVERITLEETMDTADVLMALLNTERNV